MGFCFQAFRWKTAPSSALQPLRMLRQFVGTKLALICDPILRCLYLNRSNFQLLVNLVEMDEFWLYCSFHSGNDFSSAVPYQCFMRVHASSVISLLGSAVSTLTARRRFLSNLHDNWLSEFFTFNLGVKICRNILYNNPVPSNLDASCRLLLLPLCFSFLDFHQCLKLITEFSLR